jgi:archaellum biogenesis ATPase FlaH
MAETFFTDEDFQDSLVTLLCRDMKALNDCGALLKPDDFKPLQGMRHGRPRWIIAELALEHFRKYHEPVGRLLRANVLEYAVSLSLGERQITELKEYCDRIRAGTPFSPESITEKVIHYKHEHLKALAVQELVELQSSGQLTDEKWYEISQRTLAPKMGLTTTDYLETLKDRNARRKYAQNRIRRPWTYIDPLDNLIQGLGPKELGLILAPYKRGKSLMLQWLAIAYVLQRLNVLYVTLENPQSSVEDRMDSIVTHIPIKVLSEYPGLATQRFTRFKNMVHRQLKIYDGTMGGVTVPLLEQILLSERDKGFLVDALIVDYDDEIKAVVKQKDRRFEFADIYRDLRQMTARHNLITWTAAQTQRDTEHLKILSGDRAAEDISKIRKVSLAIGMGRGDWENGESIYLWVAAANNDQQHVGCTIMPDRAKMIVYDREATTRLAKQNGGYVTP